VDEEELPRNVIWLGVSALIGSMTVRLLDYWRLRIERRFNATADDGAVLSYPWLAQHPVWIGLLVGVLVFVVGLYLITGYSRTTYLRPEPPAASS
jgi:hypothetical protein